MKKQEKGTPDENWIEWRTKPGAEQRQILAKGLRRIANRLKNNEYDHRGPAPTTPEMAEAQQWFADRVQHDVGFLQSVTAYIVDSYNGSGTLTPL